MSGSEGHDIDGTLHHHKRYSGTAPGKGAREETGMTPNTEYHTFRAPNLMYKMCGEANAYSSHTDYSLLNAVVNNTMV